MKRASGRRARDVGADRRRAQARTMTATQNAASEGWRIVRSLDQWTDTQRCGSVNCMRAVRRNRQDPHALTSAGHR